MAWAMVDQWGFWDYSISVRCITARVLIRDKYIVCKWVPKEIKTVEERNY